MTSLTVTTSCSFKVYETYCLWTISGSHYIVRTWRKNISFPVSSLLFGEYSVAAPKLVSKLCSSGLNQAPLTPQVFPQILQWFHQHKSSVGRPDVWAASNNCLVLWRTALTCHSAGSESQQQQLGHFRRQTSGSALIVHDSCSYLQWFNSDTDFTSLENSNEKCCCPTCIKAVW